MKNKLVTKLEETAREWFHKATPVVKREVQKTISKGTSDLKDSIFSWLTIAGIVYAVSSIGSGTAAGEHIFTNAIPSAGLIFNYREIHNTYNYYGKEFGHDT